MTATFVILFIIICIIAGFNGMMFLLAFPIIIIFFIIIAVISSKNSNSIKNIKQEDEIDNEDNTLEEHFMFEEFTDHHK